MKCEIPGVADYDPRDYYFDALSAEQSRLVQSHLNHCEPCAAEVEQLRLTARALHALPEEEMPRRIAFVSDKVFQPSPVARWFHSFWLSGARMGAAAAMLLAAAILIHAFRPARVITTLPGNPVVTHASFDRAAVQATVDQAVAKAVRESEARSDLKLQRVVAENEKQRRESMARVTEVLDSLDRQNRVMTVASNRLVDLAQ